MKSLIIVFAVAMLVIAGCDFGGPSSLGVQEHYKFQGYDVKEDYCGTHIDPSYCQCTFHNKNCDVVGLPREQVKNDLYERFGNWVQIRLDSFAKGCRENNGFVFEAESCYVCQSNFEPKLEECVPRE